MKSLGEIITSRRLVKKISLKKTAIDLHIKQKILEDIEKQNWENLPEPPFLKGLVQNYAEYLGLDVDHTMAIFRREYDEAKYQSKKTKVNPHKPVFFTPTRFVNILFAILILAFATYLALQYLSILSAPKLEVITPDNDSTTTVPVTKITGRADKDSTVSVSGEFVPVASDGNFSYEQKLKPGKNEITIIASKKLSPKSKVTRIVRLVN